MQTRLIYVVYYKMSSQPQSYIIPQTNKAWIKVPTNGGTYRIHENYNGVDVFQPYEIEATGTSTHTRLSCLVLQSIVPNRY